MGAFKDFFENKVFAGLKPGDIDWWAKYSQSKIFPSEAEARQWVFDRRQYADKQTSAQVFGVDGPEYNRAFANAIPLYQSGKSWKIGKRIRVDHRLRLKDLEIKMPDYEELVQIAQANGTADFKFHKVRLIPLRFTIEDVNKDYYMTGQRQRIENLAYQIKQNRWIEPVVYEYPSFSIIEGQHRARAMKLLGFNMIPGIGIEYEED